MWVCYIYCLMCEVCDVVGGSKGCPHNFCEASTANSILCVCGKFL